jgi:hypothetical protein
MRLASRSGLLLPVALATLVVADAQAASLKGTVVQAGRERLALATPDLQVHVLRGADRVLASGVRGRRVRVHITARGRVLRLRLRPGRASRVAFVTRVTRAGALRVRVAPGLELPASGASLVRGDRVRVTLRLTRRGTIRAARVVAAGPRASIGTVPARGRPAASPTAPPEPPAPVPTGPVLFEDTFDGAAGAPDPSKWVTRGERCDAFTAVSCPKDDNVFVDGAGNLVLRVAREPEGWLGGRYSGAFVGTFQYGWGWPPKDVRASWAPPYHVEMRALMPNSPALWPVAWDMNVDRTQAQGISELDWAEQRMTHPEQATCHSHHWVDGKDTDVRDGALEVSHMGRNWHTYSADVFADRVEYRVDGRLCGTGPGVSGRFGLLLSSIVGAPDTWGADGASPDPADPGPWDFKVDHVRVTSH